MTQPKINWSKDITSQLDEIFATVTLARLELWEIIVPQVEVFRAAIGIRKERHVLFVRWIDCDGNFGIGECSCRPDPFFNCEFLEGAILVLSNYIFPLLKKETKYSELCHILQKVRGWNFTAAAVEAAFFDLLRRQGIPDLLDLWPGEKIEKIPVGVSLGLFPSSSAAIKRMEKVIAEGYNRIKLKISPRVDFAFLKDIRHQFPDLYLGYDANGSFNEKHMDFLLSLQNLNPDVLEQPFAPGRIDLCCELKKQSSLPICLDESIADIGNLITAHRLNAFDEINIKPGRVGGIGASLALMEYCYNHKIYAWIGGMFETGIGRLANLRVAARLPLARAHDLSPSKRYFKQDIVHNPISMDKNGCIDLSQDQPVEVDMDIVKQFLVNKTVLKP